MLEQVVNLYEVLKKGSREEVTIKEPQNIPSQPWNITQLFYKNSFFSDGDIQV